MKDLRNQILQERNQEIIDFYKNDFDLDFITNKFGLTHRVVINIIKGYEKSLGNDTKGVRSKYHYKLTHHPKFKERDDQILSLKKEGKTYKEIAGIVGVSTAIVYQTFYRYRKPKQHSVNFHKVVKLFEEGIKDTREIAKIAELSVRYVRQVITTYKWEQEINESQQNLISQGGLTESIPEKHFDKENVNLSSRLSLLKSLLSQGSFSKEEIAQLLPVYADLTKRSLERDLLNLSKTGNNVVAERHPGSRWVSYRLAEAPTRREPIPERAWQKTWQKSLADVNVEVSIPEKFLGVDEVAKILHLSGRRVTEFCKSGRLKSQKVGRRYIIRLVDLQEFAKIERSKSTRFK